MNDENREDDVSAEEVMFKAKQYLLKSLKEKVDSLEPDDRDFSAVQDNLNLLSQVVWYTTKYPKL